jgi:hypothetical protein
LSTRNGGFGVRPLRSTHRDARVPECGTAPELDSFR